MQTHTLMLRCAKRWEIRFLGWEILQRDRGTQDIKALKKSAEQGTPSPVPCVLHRVQWSLSSTHVSSPCSWGKSNDTQSSERGVTCEVVLRQWSKRPLIYRGIPGIVVWKSCFYNSTVFEFPFFVQSQNESKQRIKWTNSHPKTCLWVSSCHPPFLTGHFLWQHSQ